MTTTNLRGPPTLRVRRKRATREALAAEAMALFVAHGFDAVSVDEIAIAAGVSRRTFFRYFPTKESVFFAAQEARLAAFQAALAAPAATGDAGTLIRNAALLLADRYEGNRAAILSENDVLSASTVLHAYDAQLDANWERALQSALERSYATTDDAAAQTPDALREDAIVVAGAVLGVMRAVLRAWLESRGAFDLRVRGVHALARLAPLLAIFSAPATADPTQEGT